MTNLLECQDFVSEIQDNTLAEINDVLVTIHTVVTQTDGTSIVHFSPEDHPSWKMAIDMSSDELVKTFVPVTW